MFVLLEAKLLRDHIAARLLRMTSYCAAQYHFHDEAVWSFNDNFVTKYLNHKFEEAVQLMRYQSDYYCYYYYYLFYY